MSNIESRNLLESIVGYAENTQGYRSSADRPVRIGTIDPYYTTGLPKVLLDGETSTGAKGFTWVSTYTPRAGDRVILIPVGQSYIIGGKIVSSQPIQSIPLTLQNSWRPYDADNSYYTPAVTRTETGVVKLSGLLTGGAIAYDTVVTILPPPFRPNSKLGFSTLIDGYPTALYITTDGKVVLNGSYTVQPTSGYLTLDNIIFNNHPDTQWNSHTLVSGWYENSTIQYALDSMGRVWHQGAASYNSSNNPAGESAITSAVSAQFRPAKQLHLKNASFSATSYIDILASGEIRYKSKAGFPSDYTFDPIMYPASTKSFTNLTYQNGWKSNGTGFPSASYWKDPEGLVHVQGLVNGGTVGATIATLPAGCRPSKIILRSTVSNDASARLDIYPDGRIVASTGSNAWFSLDGVVFVAEQ